MTPILKAGISMPEKKLRAIRTNKKICTQTNRCARALTFVEVLVALAVVSISLLALLRLHLISANMADKALITAEAVLLAQEKIAEVLAHGYHELKTESGVVENSRCPLYWQTQVNNLQLSQLNRGRASGPVVGGNLTSICHLLGTPYEPRFEGHLLLLEDRGEAPYRIDRMLSQLRLAGHLDGIAGVILGSFQDCGSPEDVYAIVKEAFRHTGVPILAGFDLGHGTDNLTVPIGLEADLDTEDGSLRFQNQPPMRTNHEGHTGIDAARCHRRCLSGWCAPCGQKREGGIP